MNLKQSLVLQNLTLSYERHPAIHHLNGCFEGGSLTAILGPNGAGKSTLLRALAQLHPIDEGQIARNALNLELTAYLPQAMILEKDFPIDVGQMIRQGFFKEQSFLSFKLNVEQQVRFEQALELTQLKSLEKKPIRTLSLGQLQRARWARLMVQNAQLILLDEPFTGLDENTTVHLLEVMLNWHKQGRTIIAAIHDEKMAAKYFSHCLVLNKNAVNWGPTAEVLVNHNSKNLQKDQNIDENEICAQ
jgi:zinc/manganese transport system ATP-binding protein